MRAAALTGAVLVSVLLSGCSSEADKPTPEEVAALAWSPCDDLTEAQVSRIAGEPMTEQNGTTDAQRCTFTPVTEGGPAYDLNYLWFDGSLDDALEAMGAGSSKLVSVSVPGADSARLAVRERPSGILVSGFVQTEGLVQSVNAVQLRPYDKATLLDSTTDLLTELAKTAPQQ